MFLGYPLPVFLVLSVVSFGALFILKYATDRMESTSVSRLGIVLAFKFATIVGGVALTWLEGSELFSVASYVPLYIAASVFLSVLFLGTSVFTVPRREQVASIK